MQSLQSPSQRYGLWRKKNKKVSSHLSQNFPRPLYPFPQNYCLADSFTSYLWTNLIQCPLIYLLLASAESAPTQHPIWSPYLSQGPGSQNCVCGADPQASQVGQANCTWLPHQWFYCHQLCEVHPLLLHSQQEESHTNIQVQEVSCVIDTSSWSESRPLDISSYSLPLTCCKSLPFYKKRPLDYSEIANMCHRAWSKAGITNEWFSTEPELSHFLSIDKHYQ